MVPGYFTTTVADVKLGSLSLPPVRFLVIDLQTSIGDGTIPLSNGFLSYVALKDRAVTLDYRRHRVTISQTGAEIAAPKDAGTITYPTFGQKGPPIVATTGFEVNGKSITVQVDTLYAYFVTPKVHLPDGMFDGTVGGELFVGHSITFDFHANRFWIG